MSTLGESIKPFHRLGYNLSNSTRSISTLQYADDTCLVADGPSSCQELLNHMDHWMRWSGMKAKVPKCHSLALKATSGQPYNPKLTLQGDAVPFIGSNPVKFLGTYIQIPPDHHRMRGLMDGKLRALLEKMNLAPITRNQKLLLYKAGTCPRVLWDMGISDLPTSWITKNLEATATRYLNLSRSADPSRLYLTKKNGGINFPNITTLYRKVKVSIACQLLMFRDPLTQHISRIQTIKEEAQKRNKFHPMLLAREVIRS